MKCTELLLVVSHSDFASLICRILFIFSSERRNKPTLDSLHKLFWCKVNTLKLLSLCSGLSKDFLFLYVLSSANRVKSLHFLQVFFFFFKTFCQKRQYVLAFIHYNEWYNKCLRAKGIHFHPDHLSFNLATVCSLKTIARWKFHVTCFIKAAKVL